MPHDTFHNLPANKQKTILDAAIAEFAQHDFATARLDRIAAAAGIAKGSLFQYFADKSDCYVHSVTVALERAWQFYERYIARRAPNGCFELLSATILSMGALKQAHPDLARLYLRVVYARDSHQRDQLYQIFVARNNEFFDRLYREGVATGQIDPALSEGVVRTHIHAVGAHLIYILLSGDRPPWFPRSRTGVTKLINESVAVLATAIRSPRRSRARAATRKQKQSRTKGD